MFGNFNKEKKSKQIKGMVQTFSHIHPQKESKLIVIRKWHYQQIKIYYTLFKKNHLYIICFPQIVFY